MLSAPPPTNSPTPQPPPPPQKERKIDKILCTSNRILFYTLADLLLIIVP